MPDRFTRGLRFHVRWEQLALRLWIVILVAVCIRAAIWPEKQTVYPTYAEAARHWVAGEELYGRPGNYRYSPLVAVTLLPFSLFPDRAGGVLWRLFNAGIYLAAFAWWCRRVLPASLTKTDRALLFILLIPLSINSINNGQSNPLVIGLLLAASAALATERWNLAAACAAAAALFKIYPIAVGLLLASVYPRKFAPRFALGLVGGLALPFLMQDAGYVLAQYASWAEHLRMDDRRLWPPEIGYRDLLLLLRVWLAAPSLATYVALQLLTAAAIAAFCVAASLAGWPRRRLLSVLLALGVCWMTLLGPATESSTYVLLAPSLSWSLFEAWRRPHPLWLRVGLSAAYGLFLSAGIAGWFPFVLKAHALGLHPLGALLLLLSVLASEIRRFSEPSYENRSETA